MTIQSNEVKAGEGVLAVLLLEKSTEFHLFRKLLLYEVRITCIGEATGVGLGGGLGSLLGLGPVVELLKIRREISV